MRKKVGTIIIYAILLVFCGLAIVEVTKSRQPSEEKVVSTSSDTEVSIAPTATNDTDGKQEAAATKAPGQEVAAVSEGTEEGSQEGNTTASGELLEHVKEVMAKSAELPSENPVVGIGQGTDYASVTQTAIDNAGGLKDIVSKGDVVLIKPNLCINAKPDSPITTDYRVVAQLVKAVKEAGASRIIIAEGCFSGQAFTKATFMSNKYDTIEGVEFYNINDCKEEDCYALMTEDSLIGKDLYIPKIYMDADVVISAAKLKTHFVPEAFVTLSLKNCFGVMSTRIYGLADKSGLHSFGVSNAIVEINKIRRPDFVVIDGIIGGEGYGPVYNTAVDSQIVFAGTDPVAVDTVALNFMGFSVDQADHIQLAAKEGVGIDDISKIRVEGAKLDEIKMSFDK